MIYNSIHNCPIGIFERVKKDNDLTLLSTTKISEKRLNDIYMELMDEYFDEYGIGETYKEWIELKKKELIAYEQSLIGGDRTKNTDAKIFAAKAHKLIEGSKGMTFKDCKEAILKTYSVFVKENEITVKEFYDIIENLKSR